jgi:hypothetical protein
VSRQQELVPLLAHYLGVQPEEVFYRWAMSPRCEQHGLLGKTNWAYFFHGAECDLKNSLDGRFLRLDFGPRGKFDTFSGFGILQFVMTTKAPWREFPELREFFAETSPPYNELSGSHAKMSAIANRLKQLGFFEVADKELFTMVEQHTEVQPDGSRSIHLPSGFNDPTQHAFWDVGVCHRWVLSELGKQTIKSGRQV